MALLMGSRLEFFSVLQHACSNVLDELAAHLIGTTSMQNGGAMSDEYPDITLKACANLMPEVLRNAT